MATNEKIIWDGQGPVFIGTYDPVQGTPEMGYLSGLYRIGCGTRTLTTSLTRETKKIKESCSGQRLDLMEIETGKSLEIKLELVEFDRRTLAAAFFGKDIVQTAGSVTGEKLPPVAQGDYIFLKHPRADNILISDSDTSAPTVLTENTHWRWDSQKHGAILILDVPTGITLPLQVSYDHESHVSIGAFSASKVQRGLIFTGTNQRGQTARVVLPRLSLGMDGDFSWIGDEESSLSLSGSALYVPELAADASWGGFMRIDALPE